MKKLSILLIMGALCAGLLVGCGATDTESNVSSDSASTVSSEVSSATDTSSTEASSTPDSSTEESTDPTPSTGDDASVEMILDEIRGDNIGQFVKIVGADNSAVQTINSEIESLMAQYQTESTKGDGSWAEYQTYVDKDSKYLNIVMLYNVYPTYGNQGNLASFTYDMENETIVSTADVERMTGKTESAIRSAFESYYRDSNTAHQYREVTQFTVAGASAYENGQADIYLAVTTDDKADAPPEYQTSSNKELYIFHSDDASFELVQGDNLFINNGRQAF